MSDKDSYWFRHDASAGRGLKMRKMAHIYGHQGKGLYWDVVEILRDQKEYKFESDESSLNLLCDLVGFKDNIRFISWFKDCLRIGLFDEEEGFFICPPLCKNMVRWEASKNNGSKGGRPKKKPIKNLTNNLEKTIIEEKRREDIYTIQNFIKNWVEMNNGKSSLKTLSESDKEHFIELRQNYSKKDFHDALNGMFKQQKLFPVCTSTPKHFLDPNNFVKYLDAFKNKKFNLYG